MSSVSDRQQGGRTPAVAPRGPRASPSRLGESKRGGGGCSSNVADARRASAGQAPASPGPDAPCSTGARPGTPAPSKRSLRCAEPGPAQLPARSRASAQPCEPRSRLLQRLWRDGSLPTMRCGFTARRCAAHRAGVARSCWSAVDAERPRQNPTGCPPCTQARRREDSPASLACGDRIGNFAATGILAAATRVLPPTIPCLGAQAPQTSNQRKRALCRAEHNPACAARLDVPSCQSGARK